MDEIEGAKFVDKDETLVRVEIADGPVRWVPADEGNTDYRRLLYGETADTIEGDEDRSLEPVEIQPFKK